jgi:hypothetical protein
MARMIAALRLVALDEAAPRTKLWSILNLSNGAYFK